MYPKAATGEPGSAPGSPSFPELERKVLEYWERDRTFIASVDAREPGDDGCNEFVFYDGPPFANGLPHYGHLLTGYAKDLIPRYQTMKGRRVERRFGWDCHGLPAELEAQRILGVNTKADVLAMGIEKFNEACRSSVLAYTREWREYVTRQARWVDFDSDYKTLDLDYMESVMWAFRALHDKGLVYEGVKVLPYCWNDETPLSNHELRMDDDAYRDRSDPAVTFWVQLESGDRLLVWTTTPWTLPSNLAMAVREDIKYVAIEHDGHRYVIAEARVAAYEAEFGTDASSRIVATFVGADLLGLSYTPLFPFFLDEGTWGTASAFRIIAAAHVNTDDGTGIVHMAPAYGEEDQEVCEAVGIPTILTVDDRARFTDNVPPFEGLDVFSANPRIVADLRASGRLFRNSTIVHSYPHCWRCREPLIYKAVSSWFVEVTKIKARMLELNEDISWTPSHIKRGQFGRWLTNARDWSISRNRFWGSPIPVWKSDDPNYPRTDVYGSIAQLREDFGIDVRDLHRPYVDQLTRPNPDDPTGRSTMRRVPEVLDVWFDSGSMPFAQMHYPFETESWFEHHYPGDFIVEYVGQTRGWFYTLHVLGTALFDRPAFKSCVSHGIVLGDDGQKMSKSLRNYPDVNEMFVAHGADAMRWFLMSSSVLGGGNLVVTEKGVRDGVRQVLIPLWNVWTFFTMYANTATGEVGEGYEARWNPASSDILDRYILGKTHVLTVDVEASLDVYDISGACDLIRDFLDVLTNWYVRRSRSRFWDGEAEGSADAFDSLYTVLEVLTRVTSPFLPLIAEEIWRGLTGGRSVHLTDWPTPGELPHDPQLAEDMDLVRLICSLVLSVRKKRGLRVRLPLNNLTVVIPKAGTGFEALAPLIADEVNVHRVTVLSLDSVEGGHYAFQRRLSIDARAAGPRLGAQVQAVIRASKTGDWSVDDSNQVVAGGIALREGEYAIETVISEEEGQDRSAALLPDGGFVILDTKVTPELEAEGLARDIIRLVQQVRRQVGKAITSRVSVEIESDEPSVIHALEIHRQTIMKETLSDSMEVSRVVTVPANDAVIFAMNDGSPVYIRVN